ncbi:MAG: ABC transporter permease, partial [Sedimenticola sp.]
MRPRLVRRPAQSTAMVYASPLLALLLTLTSGIILFSIMGVPPGAALYAFFIEPLSTLYGVAELGVKATPLVLIGIALALGFRANVWNIGAEGQLTLGAIFGGSVGLFFYNVESIFILPLMLLSGIAGGMLWAAIPAF